MINLKKFYDLAVAADTAKTAKAVEIQKLFDSGETEKGLEMKKDLEDLTKKSKEAHEMYLSMVEATQGEDPAKNFVPAGKKVDEVQDLDILKSNEYTRAFFKALGTGASLKEFTKSGVPEGMEILMKALTETGGTPAGADGGFLLPVDFNNMIIERQRQFISLANHINVETVQNYSGWRAIEKAAVSTPFAKLTVDGSTEIPASSQPEFAKIPYTVSDYGGYLPVSNDLLEDTPVNIMSYLSRYFGKKVVLTDNSLVIPFLKALTPTTLEYAKQSSALDSIMSIFNVTLDPSISVVSEIITNQDGMDLLDHLKDDMKRPLLQPDPTNPTQYRVKGRLVVPMANRLLPSYKVGTDTVFSSPFFIGDGREFLTKFQRAGLEMASTNIGGSAWRTNNTEVRCIMRCDHQKIDDEAMAALTVQLTAAS